MRLSIRPDFLYHSVLEDAKPVFKTLPGWKTDISGVRKYAELSKEARDYIRICRGGNRLPDELYFGRPGTRRVLCESVMEDVYESPFSGRYSSEEMLRLFSKRTRHETWRKL